MIPLHGVYINTLLILVFHKLKAHIAFNKFPKSWLIMNIIDISVSKKDHNDCIMISYFILP